ncbi:MAG: J domain-containing protein [Oscillospiraceae bacterium]|nr:J domain-containing protein [Oscillospiraceae bacterium]
MNYYEFLGIPRDATDSDIKNAYKRMAKKYHPDVSEGCADYAHEKMQQINQAYSVLGNNTLREEYDYSLWQEERANQSKTYTDEYKDYVPQNSRTNPGEYRSEWQKYYGTTKKPPRKARKPVRSERAKKIMRLVWALRIIIPSAVIIMILGIIFRIPFMMNTLDRFYGRGTLSNVTKMYFAAINEYDFDRAAELSGGSLSAGRGTDMSQLTAIVAEAHSFKSDGIPYGRIWFENEKSRLHYKIINTKREDFISADVTVEVTNLNMEKIFTLAQINIENDLRKGTGKLILLRAIREKDLSLVEEVYEEYINEVIAAMPDEYLKTTVVLYFYRPVSMWVIRGNDNPELLKNVILGGFGKARANNYEDYIYIDWHEALRID